MTVGKYYCDYCDKEFQDTSAARKRHLQGVLHHRNRKLWYDSLSDPNQQLNVPPPSFGIGVCNRFVQTGFCPYGDSCKYHHPSHNLQGSTIQGTSIRTPARVCAVYNNLSNLTFDKALSGFSGSSQPLEGVSLQGHVARQSFGMSLGNLPPSLMPPPEGGYPSLPFVDWG